MKKLTTVSILVIALAMFPLAAFAQDAAAVYDAKCKSCHGPDGKKLAKADLTSAQVQAKAESALVKYLLEDAKHKPKVADEATAKALVAHVKTLK